jgi:hypothetical protein
LARLKPIPVKKLQLKLWLIQSTLVSATSMMGLDRQGWLEHMDVVVHSMEEEGGVNRDPATGQS